MAFLDGHQLELGLLVDMQARVWVVLAIPGDIRTTGEMGHIPASTTHRGAEDSLDGNDLDTEPGLEEGRCLLNSLSGSSGHDDKGGKGIMCTSGTGNAGYLSELYSEAFGLLQTPGASKFFQVPT